MIVLTLFILLAFPWPLIAAPASPPNVILLMVDTLRADKLGAYGSKAPASPELDALAARGIVFDSMISQASWTRASVASILSGLYPHKHGVLKEKWDLFADSIETLPEVLHSFGYYTIGITANPQLNRSFGFAQGFDQYSDSTILFGWMKREAGKTKARKSVSMRSADDVLSQALTEIDKAPRVPWYFQVMLMDVHAHHRITPDEVDKDLRAYPDAAYLQTVRTTSRAIGKFIADLEAHGKMENTIVIFTSDHGEGLLDHPHVKASHFHGNLLYRSHIHVPCIVFGDQHLVARGRRIPVVTQLVDLMPTVLDLTGSSTHGARDGISRAKWLAVDSPAVAAAESRPAFSETSWREVDKTSVTDGEWLYIESRDGWRGTDPSELQPLRGTQDGSRTNVVKNHPEIGERLKTALMEYGRTAQGAAAQASQAKLSPPEVEQLKSLGYLK